VRGVRDRPWGAGIRKRRPLIRLSSRKVSNHTKGRPQNTVPGGVYMKPRGRERLLSFHHPESAILSSLLRTAIIPASVGRLILSAGTCSLERFHKATTGFYKFPSLPALTQEIGSHSTRRAVHANPLPVPVLVVAFGSAAFDGDGSEAAPPARAVHVGSSPFFEPRPCASRGVPSGERGCKDVAPVPVASEA